MTGRAIDAGKATFLVELQDRITQKIKKVEKRIQESAKRIGGIGDRIENASRQIGAIGTGLAAFGGTATAVFGKAAIEAGNFAETLSKFETVFGGQSDNVREWAKTFGKQVGRSESQLLGFLASAQDTFIPLGFNEQEAADFSKQLTRLAVDLASFNNITDEDAFNRLLSSVVGNTENLRAFGVVAQDAQIKAEAMAKGFDANNLSPYEKALSIVSLAMKGTTAAQGDAIKTAGSFNNRVKALQSSFTDLVQTIGKPLLGPATKLAELLTRIVERIKDFAERNGELVKRVAVVSAAIAAAGGAIAGLGIALAGSALVFKGISTALATVASVLAGIPVLIGAAVAAITSPIGLIAVGVVAATAAVLKFTSVGEKIAGVFKRASAGVLNSVGRIREAFENGGVISAAKQIATEVFHAWEVLSLRIKIAWKSTTDFVSTLGESLASNLTKTMTKAALAISAGMKFAIVNSKQLIGQVAKQADEAINAAIQARIRLEAAMKGNFKGLFTTDQIGPKFELFQKNINKISGIANRAMQSEANEIQKKALDFAKTLEDSINKSQSARQAELDNLRAQLAELVSKPIHVEVEIPDVGDRIKNAFTKAAKRFSDIFAIPETEDPTAGSAITTEAKDAAKNTVTSNASVASDISAFAPTFDATKSIAAKSLSVEQRQEARLGQIFTAIKQLGTDIGGISVQDVGRSAGAAIADIAQNVQGRIQGIVREVQGAGSLDPVSIARSVIDGISPPETPKVEQPKDFLSKAGSVLDSILGGNKEEATASEETALKQLAALQKIAKKKPVMGA